MSATELSNKPHTVDLCGKTYKVRRLSVVEMLTIASDYVRSERMKNLEAAVKLVATELQPAFIATELAKMPAGVDMEAQSRKLLDEDMPDTLAYKLLFAAITDQHPKLTERDVVMLYKDSDINVMIKTFYLIAGKNTDALEQPNSKSSRKRSSGRRRK